MRARSDVMYLLFCLWALRWKVQAEQSSRTKPSFCQDNPLEPATCRENTSSLVNHQFPLDCAHSVHSVRDQINPCTALSYSPSELSATVNYPQIANDAILWQPVGFYMAGPDYKSFNKDYCSLGASNFI